MCPFHVFLEAGIARGVLAFQQAQLSVDHRSGTDGSQRTSSRTESEEDLAQFLMGSQIGCSGQSTGKYQHFGILADGLRIKQHVGLDIHSVRTGHGFLSRYRNSLDGQSGAANDVDH